MADQTTIPQAEGPAAPPAEAPAPAAPPPRRAPVQPAARQRRLPLEAIEGAAVLRCRENLRLSRRELGALLGRSTATISAWELGARVPAFSAALIVQLQRAHDRAGAALEAPRRLRQRGPVRALYELLRAAYYRKEEGRSHVRRGGRPVPELPPPFAPGIDAPAAARTGYEQGAAESLAWVAGLLEEGADLAELRAQLAERTGAAPAPTAPAAGPLSIECPQCNQGPGLGCCNYRGKGCAPHGARVRAARTEKGIS